MKAIEAKLNGKTLCLAELPEAGNLGAILNLIALKQKPGSARRGKRWKSGFSVGGLSVKGDDYTFVKYTQMTIRQGDEITLRVVDVAKPLRPKSQYIETKADRLKSQHQYVTHMTKALRKQK